LDSFGALGWLDCFVSRFGRTFYKVESSATGRTITLQKSSARTGQIAEKYELNGEAVVPFWAGKTIDWEII
jgi:dihydroorotase